jgi:hypothetical protein
VSVGLILRDPLIEHGRFRVLLRSDGVHIVYDPERPLAKRTVSEHTTKDAADRAAKKLHQETVEHAERRAEKPRT